MNINRKNLQRFMVHEKMYRIKDDVFNWKPTHICKNEDWMSFSVLTYSTEDKRIKN